MYTKNEILANKCLNQMKFFVSLFVYSFFLCQCLCIQKMNVFKNDNWPGDYYLCSYLSMSASLLTDCCLVSQRKVQGLARWHLPPEY